jgi:ribosomal protein S27E
MSDMHDVPKENLRPDLRCQVCGSSALHFNPSKNALECQHCGAVQDLDTTPDVAAIEELDFEAALQNTGKTTTERKQLAVVKCPSCYAQVSLPENLTSDECPFCGTVLVIQQGSLCEVIQPKSLLPFAVDRNKAQDLYKVWLSKLWFAPNDLVKRAQISEKLKGMYIPYWTYDSQTYTTYQGQRGDNYTVTETYKDADGNTQTRQVTKVRWTNVSGSVNHFFDDVCVAATNTLPRTYMNDLEPWDTKNLVVFDERFLSGFQTETYQVELKEGFEHAKKQMDTVIRSMIRRQIGGDQQRIDSLQTKHSQITFKHVLMPLWISAYRYNEKPYRFLINGRTGKVRGERPYSIFKIAMAVIAALIALGLLIYFTQ